MAWQRFDDKFFEQPRYLKLSFETRHHLTAMIGTCSRLESWDGFLSQIQAERCSDVPDPAGSLAQLVEANWLMEAVGGGYVILDFEENHAPPLWVRNKTAQNKLDKRLKTAHSHGDHSLCEPEKCDVLKPGSASKSSSGSASPSAESSSSGSASKSSESGAESSSESQDRYRTGQEQKALKEEAPEIEKPSTVTISDPWAIESPPAFEDPCVTPGCQGRLNQGQVNKGARICAQCAHQAQVSA